MEQDKEIKKIRKSIQVLNHNSTDMAKNMKQLCVSLTKLTDDFREHKEEYIETRTDVRSIKKMVWFIFSSIMFGTILSIFGGVFFLFLR